MGISFHVDIVSLEAEIFSGAVEKLFVSGEMGELEVLNGHAPLLTSLKPGPIWIVRPNGQEEVFYTSGGIIEVQPKSTTVFAYTALRAKDVDEAKALEAKKRAEQQLSRKGAEIDYAQAQSQLAEAMAQLRALEKLRKGHRR